MDYNDKYLKYKSKYLYFKKGGAAVSTAIKPSKEKSNDDIKKITDIFKDIFKEWLGRLFFAHSYW
jgi:hypothetical protein